MLNTVNNTALELWDGWGMWHVWDTIEVHAVFWWEGLKERDHLENLGVAGSTVLIWIFKKWDREAWTGLIRFRVGTGGGPL